MAEPKEKLANLKVLTVAEKGSFFSKKQNKELKQYEVVLQGVDDPTVVRTGMANEPLPDGVEAGGTAEDVWIYEDSYNGKITTKFFFPQKKGDGGSGGGTSSTSSWKGGRQEDVELKLVSFAMSYAKDLAAATPEAELQGMFDTADAIFRHMYEMYKKAKA